MARTNRWRFLVSLSLALGPVSAASAQDTRTTCNSVLGRTDCQTTKVTSLSEVFKRLNEERQLAREAASQEAFQAQLQALVESSMAADAARAENDALRTRTDAASAAAARAKHEAAARLFQGKAGAALNAIGDSLGLSGASHATFLDRAAPILQDIFVANPLASTIDIRDNLTPLVEALRSRRDRYSSQLSLWEGANVASMGLSSAEMDKLRGTVSLGLQRALSLDTPDAQAGLPIAELDSVLAAVAANRRACLSTLGIGTCDEQALPTALTPKASQARAARQQAERRRATEDSAHAFVIERKRVADSTANAPFVERKRVADSTANAPFVERQRVADSTANARLRERLRLACEREPEACDVEALPISERGAVKKIKLLFSKAPVSSRLNGAVAEVVRGRDTIVNFKGRFGLGTSAASVRRQHFISDGTSKIAIEWRYRAAAWGPLAPRESEKITVIIDSVTAAWESVHIRGNRGSGGGFCWTAVRLEDAASVRIFGVDGQYSEDTTYVEQLHGRAVIPAFAAPPIALLSPPHHDWSSLRGGTSFFLPPFEITETGALWRQTIRYEAGMHRTFQFERTGDGPVFNSGVQVQSLRFTLRALAMDTIPAPWVDDPVPTCPQLMAPPAIPWK